MDWFIAPLLQLFIGTVADTSPASLAASQRQAVAECRELTSRERMQEFCAVTSRSEDGRARCFAELSCSSGKYQLWLRDAHK